MDLVEVLRCNFIWRKGGRLSKRIVHKVEDFMKKGKFTKEKYLERGLFILVGFLATLIPYGNTHALDKQTSHTTSNVNSNQSAQNSTRYVNNKLCLQCHQPEAKVLFRSRGTIYE